MARSNEIRFFSNPIYKDEDVVGSVAQIIIGKKDFYEQEPNHGYKWVIAGNTWWMDKDSETGELVLAYRYGFSEEMQAKIQALRTVILWRLGLEHFNPR